MPVSYEKNMTRSNRTKIMPRKIGLAVPANVKLKLAKHFWNRALVAMKFNLEPTCMA